MPTFAAVVDVTEQEPQNAQEFASIWGDVERDTEELGGGVLDTYALLGRHDFLTLFDAPDLASGLQISLAMERHGLDMETMVAIPVEEFGSIVEDL